MRWPYTLRMVIEIRSSPSRNLLALEHQRDDARENYFAHIDPGGLTPAEKRAWEYDQFALQLLLGAAQMRLDAEEKLQLLLKSEVAA